MSMAASSSSSLCSAVDPSPHKYDVFISFRGGTRNNFTSHLYSAFCRRKIKAYIGEVSLEKGDDISRTLLKAIEESAISIIIFLENYELVHILKCKQDKAQIVLPIFQGIDPSDIRKQKRSGAAFLEYEERFENTVDKVQEWRQALIEASGLSGWDLQGKSESVIVETVVEDVKRKLKYIGSSSIDKSNGLVEDMLHWSRSKEKLLKQLKTKLRSANVLLNDAEEKQLTNTAVKEWLDDLKDIIYRADELTEKINYEVLRRKLEGTSESSTSSGTFDKSVEDKIAEIFFELKELTAQKDELGLTELTENIVSQRLHGSVLALEFEVYGREDDKEAIMKFVLSDEDSGDKIPVVFPIVGMGGIGNTTLTHLVYNDNRVKNHFRIKVWVTISTEFDVFNTTKQIFKEVTSREFDSKEISQLQLKLSEALDEKKFFFVLHDVWNDDYLLWNELRRLFAFGSKIIVTTRNSFVASTMSKAEARNLGGLSDKNCWKLFFQYALKNEDLNAISKKLVKKLLRSARVFF